jgi:HK97 family phage major capsid protein
MPLKQLVEKRNELAAKQAKLEGIFTEGRGPDGKGKDIDLDLITSIKGTQSDKLNEIRKLNDDLNAIGQEVERLIVVEKAAERVQEEHGVKPTPVTPVKFVEQPGADKSFGDIFVESDAYKEWRPGRKNNRISCEIKDALRPLLKTTFSTSAGWAPENLRTGRIIEEALRPLQVLDTIPPGTTTQAAVVYMEETTVTSAAAERAEAAAYAESTLALTEQTSTVRSIGTSLPVTDEQLADVPQVRSYLNMRLPNLVRRRLDGQLLTGDGIAPNLDGINNVSGVQTQALGADQVPDAMYKAMRLVRVTGRAMPNIVYMHPTDWQGVRLLRTNDGMYVWGNPSEAGPMRIWGVLVDETDAQTQGTGLTGDTTYTQLFIRQDVIVEIGLDSDDFTKGIQTVRCGLRAAFVVYRPAAFCQVTGM